MINPNIERRVLVVVSEDSATAEFRGIVLDIIYEMDEPKKKPGRRYMYLRYSILTDRYYLRTYRPTRSWVRETAI